MEMKFYTEDEMLDKHIGKIGTAARDKFEDDFNTFLIGEAIKEARKSPIPQRNNLYRVKVS